jgi:hypothetical protein
VGTFTDSEQRAMDQESGRQEDAHHRRTSAALEDIKRKVDEHPLLVAENAWLRLLLKDALPYLLDLDPDHDDPPVRQLLAVIRAALAVTP